MHLRDGLKNLLPRTDQLSPRPTILERLDRPIKEGVTRNAPALFNLAWQKEFMWDGAINHIDMQALAP
jgi:hypothetical protein